MHQEVRAAGGGKFNPPRLVSVPSEVRVASSIVLGFPLAGKLQSKRSDCLM